MDFNGGISVHQEQYPTMQYTILRNMATASQYPPEAQLNLKVQQWIESPTNTDVLLGRGVATNRHPGNENFRDIISQHVDTYVSSTKKQKMMISRSIVDTVNKKLQPPGRFLEKNPETGLWSEVDDKKALEKTAQALRDGAAPLRKQLSEDMSDPNFLSAVFDDKFDDIKPANAPKPKGHRRMKSAPVRPLAIPIDALPLAKKRRSKPDLSAVSPVPVENNVQLNIQQFATPSPTPPMVSTSPLELSLSPLTTNSPKETKSKKSRHHRRHRTFGGYSCSDSNAASFLTKEDLSSGIPPLFASQLQSQSPEEQIQPIPWPPIQHPLSAQSAPVATSGPTRRHRRHNTVDSYTLTHPVFSDDPNLNFAFPIVSQEQIPETQQHHQSVQAHSMSIGHQSDFSSLEIPDLPLPSQPPTKKGRGHRRVHTTGRFDMHKKQDFDFQLDAFAPLPLEPVQEEKQVWEEPHSISQLLENLEPLDHKPTNYEAKSSNQNPAAPQSLLGNEDFFKMIADDDSVEKSSVVDDEKGSLSGELKETHLIGLGYEGAFSSSSDEIKSKVTEAKSEKVKVLDDEEFTKAMGSDDVFLNLCKSDPIDFDSDVLFDKS